MSDDEKGRVTTVRIVPNAAGDGKFEGDSAVIAEAVEVYALGRARGERRRVTWGDEGRASMTRLAKLFPSLNQAPGVEPWDVDELLRWAASGVLSHGEVLAAKFVLSVWNPGTDWEEIAREDGLLEDGQWFRRFDLFEAMNVWDQEHRSAALTWIELPFFP